MKAAWVAMGLRPVMAARGGATLTREPAILIQIPGSVMGRERRKMIKPEVYQGRRLVDSVCLVFVLASQPKLAAICFGAEMGLAR